MQITKPMLIAAAIAWLAAGASAQGGSTQTITANGTTARLTYGADGRVTDCVIVTSSGVSATDAATCRSAVRMRRAGSAPQTGGPAISRALADPARADQAGDDERRQAAAVVAFSGAKPGDTVVDYLPGRYYWTRIFSGVVGPRGKVLAMWPAAGAERANKALPDTLNKWNLANVSLTVTPGNLPAAAQPADLFWTVQNYHDMANKGAGEAGLAAFNAAVFKLLKHGGTYVIIDHADTAGSGIADTDTTHRIDPAAVRRQVEAAGFRFEGESKVLANPADDHSKGVFDAAIRGRTDQFAFKFRKP
jgi:predicted methyltransferase